MGYYSPDYGNPSCDPTFLTTMKAQEKELYVTLAGPEPGCLVLFCMKRPYSTHIGIVLDDCNQFLHVMRGKDVCIEKLNHPLWKQRVTGFYKWTISL
jgi:cell wall-associated NlpC family hydrolase